ncbi:MAG: hypothetical protein LBT25_04105 [Candidatus Symbiothrix sp.]|jgi:hypothetical protein|nr:hypothetical protein [Candidatus Symbiothrix sp.]
MANLITKHLMSLGFILLQISCNHTGDTVSIHANFNNSCNEVQQTTAFEVLTKRLETLYKIKFKELSDNGSFDFAIYSKEDKHIAERLCTDRGELYIAETYEFSEIYSSFTEINRIICEDTTLSGLILAKDEYSLKYPLVSVLSPNTKMNNTTFLSEAGDGPTIGIVAEKDTAIINLIFNNLNVKDLFPEAIQFKWTKKPVHVGDNDLFYGLISLKNAASIYINQQTVEKLSGYKSDQGDSEEIHLKFNQEQARLFSEISRHNIDKSLAIVLDNNVLCSPIIHSEIKTGDLSINGRFTLEDVKYLTAIIKGGVLDCHVENLHIR